MLATLPIGSRLRRRMGGERFRTVVLVLLFASLVSLVVDLVARAV